MTLASPCSNFNKVAVIKFLRIFGALELLDARDICEFAMHFAPSSIWFVPGGFETADADVQARQILEWLSNTKGRGFTISMRLCELANMNTQATQLCHDVAAAMATHQSMEDPGAILDLLQRPPFNLDWDTAQRVATRAVKQESARRSGMRP